MREFLSGLAIGLVAAYSYFSTQPTYIENALLQDNDQFGGTQILGKLGSGQVAVIHGFLDDVTACETFKRAIERDGGSYFCMPARNAQPIDDL